MTQISSYPITPTPLSTTQNTSSNPLTITTVDFLTLLTAQLKSQDPFSPADPGDTLQQLASLSQVSGLAEIGATLKQLLANEKTSIDPAGWIGRSALVPSSDAAPSADGSYAGEVTSTGNEAIDVIFKRDDGTVVHTERLERSQSGPLAFDWDGRVNGVPISGPLKVTASAAGIPASVAVWTEVTGVGTPGLSSAVLETSLGSYPPSAVIHLR